ncbi:MAG: hypothetical protein AAGA77_05105 [Bacteroidota bacterium]
MEEIYFEEIRRHFCTKYPTVHSGKMMSSEAITYKEKVFAFFSRKKKMVFKLGKAFDPDTLEIDIQVFNPFKNRGPLNGWFEVSYSDKGYWKPLTKKAFLLLENELK